MPWKTWPPQQIQNQPWQQAWSRVTLRMETCIKM
jgi:hypothetical protein